MLVRQHSLRVFVTVVVFIKYEGCEKQKIKLTLEKVNIIISVCVIYTHGKLSSLMKESHLFTNV